MGRHSDSSLTSTCSSSNSNGESRKRKSSKKHKKEKKHKKQKKMKKHKDKNSSSERFLIKNKISTAPNEEDNAFGPALPPHLVKSPANQESSAMIGPILPNDILSKTVESHEGKELKDSPENSDDDIGYGPLPMGQELNSQQLEREQRALQLKIAVLEGRGVNPSDNDQKSREEWMLELPEVGLRSGLASLSNMKRTFYAGRDKPDFSDRSSWTKTPQSEANDSKPGTSKSTPESLKKKAEALYELARDAEQEELAKKSKKKHKRDESLMELHQKKLRKEQKKKEKELAASGAKPERRPFTRDVDLKLNKIDKHQTKQIVDKAKILNSKFSSGRTKYL